MEAQALNSIQPIKTIYNGIEFRSRLEAKYAVFFDQCKINWSYEFEGYKLPNGLWYLPDFILHDIEDIGDLFVEVKGEMSEEDFRKIRSFSLFEGRKVLVLGSLPTGSNAYDILEKIGGKSEIALNGYNIHEFSFDMINGLMDTAYPVMCKDGKFRLINHADISIRVDELATYNAYKKAIQHDFTKERKDIYTNYIKYNNKNFRMIDSGELKLNVYEFAILKALVDLVNVITFSPGVQGSTFDATKWVELPNDRIIKNSGDFSKPTFDRHRDGLKNKGLIDYRKTESGNYEYLLK